MQIYLKYLKPKQPLKYFFWTRPFGHYSSK